VTPAPPPLDDFADEWVNRSDLVHLFSLRNQWGQAHVNDDLSSLSWLAIPPFSGGYHTGVLKVDGEIAAAARLRWAPWGVQREAAIEGLSVVTDVRLEFEGTGILWSITVRNDGAAPRTVTLEQELRAPVAHSEVDWGWLYGTPWNSGHYHDYFATERLRASVLENDPGEVQLLPAGERIIRLGRPRVPGIQRHEDTAPMLMEFELPAHFAPDHGRVLPPAVIASIRAIAVSGSALPGVFVLDDPDSELQAGTAALRPGGSIGFDVRLAHSGQTGVLLTHGNHPDSLHFGLREDVPWIGIGGELVAAAAPLSTEWHRLEALLDEHGATLLVDGTPVARTSAWWSGQRWESTVSDDVVVVADGASPARSAFAFSGEPTLDADQATWRLNLDPGEAAVVGFTLQLDTDAEKAAESARTAASILQSRHEEVADRWRSLWNNAFVAGNPDHSGYLPVLESASDGLARTYYLGILLALYMRNTGVSSIKPVFLTGGPRLGPTITFYWDQSEWARTAAMLEPVGLRAWVLAALSQDYDSSHSFDTRNLLPVGNHYASNDHALFRITQAYVGVTGDTGLLDEVAGDRSVLDHLRALAYRPRSRRSAFGEHVLMDFGRDTWELLECVPSYRDGVVSFNAGYVGMLRSLAVLLRSRGDVEEAALAEADAAQLAAAVLGQYDNGRWRTSHPEGDETIGHCLDFELVAADMAEDLDEQHRTEMIAFVTDHLIDGNWMRALSPDDPMAPYSDRPDHGAAGAFAGWPGATSYGLARLGRADLAAQFLAKVHRSRSGALWGQAVEAVGDGNYRVAERGVSNRDSNAAVAVTEAIIAGLFGIRAEFAGPSGSVTSDYGTLHRVRAIGFDLEGPAG
jgi:hypothetical protein